MAQQDAKKTKTASALANEARDATDARVTVDPLVARRVWVEAGGRCTFCKEYLAADGTTGQDVFIGQLAHIVGATDGAKSPRGRSPRTRKQRAEAENLMLLCAGEHKVIDTFEHWATYDVDQLRTFKRQHEDDIRRLTGLLRKPKSTVIRVAGDIRGQVVDFSKQSVIRVLLDEQRFPDFTLHADGSNYEVDLRQHDGEDTSDPRYWSSSQLTLERRLKPLKHHLRSNNIDHISVFALARIPLLVTLGGQLDDITNVTVHNRRRDEGWGWYAEGPTEGLRFAVAKTAGEGDPLVTFSLSGPVDLDALPEELRSVPRYDIRAEGADLNPSILRSREDLQALTDVWLGVLATLEAEHRNKPISLILAVCAAAAVDIGRVHMRSAHAPLRVYDRVDDSYQFAIQTP